MPGLSRSVLAVLVALACAAAVGSAAAAPTFGRHMPFFSLLSERVPIKKLPGLEFPSKVRGTAWFGEVKRPHSTITAAGVGRQICMNIEHEAANGTGTGSGRCTVLAAARELQMLEVSENCHGKQTRVSGLVPNGVTGLAIESASGKVEGTEPVIENTVDFPVRSKAFVLHGVGTPAAEKLEWGIPVDSLRRLRVSNCIGGTFRG